MLLLVIFPFQPSAEFALFLVFIVGVINSGGLLFVVYNFMMTIEADLSKVALRIGVLEMCRYAVSWGLSAYVLLCTPSSIKPEDNHLLTTTILLLPIGIIVILCTVIPGVLILFAPGPYRDDRMPNWDFGLIFKKPSFLFLCASECMGDLAKYPSGIFLSWALAAQFKTSQIGIFCLIFVMGFVVCTGFWSLALSQASIHGYSFLLGVVVLLAPPTILRAVALEEVSAYHISESNEWALFVCAVSLLLEGVRTSSIWAAQIRILNSRWRLLSYGTAFYVISNIFFAMSPWVNEALAQPSGSTFMTTSPKQLADAVVVSLIPITIIQYVFQLCAMPFIRRDMGIPTGSKKKKNDRRHWLWRNRMPILYAIWFVIVGFMITGFVTPYAKAAGAMEYTPAFNCHVLDKSQTSNCKVLKSVNDPAKLRLNDYQQNSTARAQCLQFMLTMTDKEGADSFIFQKTADGYSCDVLSCGNKLQTYAKDGRRYQRFAVENYEVWSRQCVSSGQNLVYTVLFEWTWKDVGNECKNYLGPAGFDAVHVAPAVEHIKGDSWYIRYQPVSYKFESRSGTEADFVEMVKKCSDAGVKVVADVILNHMAGPYIQNPAKFNKNGIAECGPTTVECRGWNDTEFANRQFIHGQEGLDNFTYDHFHHYPGDQKSNCGCPPWLNNQVVCDFSGLPDLNTEDENVRRMLLKLLQKYYDMGVTMLRIDAARHMFPESQSWLFSRLPIEYTTLEVSDEVARIQSGLFRKLMQLGNIYDFSYSVMLTTLMVDYPQKPYPAGKPTEAKDTDVWVCRDDDFKRLLSWKGSEIQDCNIGTCKSPVPEEKTMLFIDNHDRQRDRFKSSVYGDNTEPPLMCDWNVKDSLHSCMLNFKYGTQYHLAMAYLLLKPYGDSVRLMSSYSFFQFRQGPPGVHFDSTHDSVIPVYDGDESKPARCRGKPITAPVTKEWDYDEEKPWICEHRWEGVSGMVRFRKLIMMDPKKNPMKNEWYDKEGRIAYSLGEVGFVMMSRGWNNMSQCGVNTTKNLTEASEDSKNPLKIGMPSGTYCNLARIDGAVPGPGSWKVSDCTSDTVIVGPAGAISHGFHPGGEVIVLHVEYPAESQVKVEPKEKVPPETSSNEGKFWGWRDQFTKMEETVEKGCCFTVDVNVYNTPTKLTTEQDVPEVQCIEETSGAEGSTRIQRGWDRRCPRTATEGFAWLLWARNSTNLPGAKEPEYWADTFLVFVVILMGEALVIACVMSFRRRDKVEDPREHSGTVELEDILMDNAS
jgi:alpha-amylase